MSNPVVRLLTTAAAALVVFGGVFLLRSFMKPAEVYLPSWDLRALPMQIGNWQAEAIELDPEVQKVIGAMKDPEGNRMVVDRVYRDGQGHSIWLHTAIFDNPDEGVRHSPINCYRSNGYDKLRETRLDLRPGGADSVEVNYSSWEKGNEQELVLYWYQFGERRLFDRFDLAGIRWEMRGTHTWPALVKVLIHLSSNETPDSEARKQDEARLRAFAERIYEWLNPITEQPATQPGPQT